MMSGVLNEAWEMYKAHWQHLMTVSGVVYVGVAVVGVILVLLLGWFGAILATLATIVGLFWVQGALVEAVNDIRDGRADLSVGDTFKRVQPYLGRIILASLLFWLAVVIGLVFIIIPGIIIFTLLVLFVPAIVLENKGVVESLKRSLELVRPHGVEVFVVGVLAMLIMFAFNIVLGILLSPFGEAAEAFLSQVISGTVTAPYVALVLTLVYFRLTGAGTPTTTLGTPPPDTTPPGTTPPGSTPPAV